MTPTSASTQRALLITVRGRVQGVGMRPAIARLAAALQLNGRVSNTGEGVEIYIVGGCAAVQAFEETLPQHFPTTANVTDVRREQVPDIDAQPKSAGFEIVSPDSTTSEVRTPLNTEVPRDRVVCPACRREILNEGDCRAGYPFTSCTCCGPRYTIIGRMPYERLRTTMAGFPMCERCCGEYGSPQDRRFHAQTNACPNCGPHVWLRDVNHRRLARDAGAVDAAANALKQGKIVALLGLGGYQLLVDATSDEAVCRLRRRKHRPAKPLAVMVHSLALAERLAHLDAHQREVLSSPEGPILIAKLRSATELSAHISQYTIGLMLPTTPLHVLLTRQMEAVVCTSGNLEGEPIAYDGNDPHLAEIADVWLEHDRPVRRPLDDSVVRVMAGKTAVLRLARGYAPHPLALSSKDVVLALGGQQKQASAASNGAQCWLGPHLGDLNNLAVQRRWLEQNDEMAQLHQLDSEAARLVVDLHPEYFTSLWAEQAARKQGQRRPQSMAVQHHHGHIAASMLEHGWLDRDVIGVAMDGSGYGPDGTIWGGEILRCTTKGFQRIAHLRPFALVGGEQAIRQPWRVAVALLSDAIGADEAAALSKRLFPQSRVHDLLQLLTAQCPVTQTSSVGRLFDAVAALILGLTSVQYEGEAAILLEQIASQNLNELQSYTIRCGSPRPTGSQSPTGPLDWRPMMVELTRDIRKGVDAPTMAMRFHRALAGAIDQCCRLWPELPVALGGGVFQNQVLVELLVERFHSRKRTAKVPSTQTLGLPGAIPVNDGGLAAGQLVIANARL